MKSLFVSASLILPLLLLSGGSGAAQTEEKGTTIKKVPVHTTLAMSGKDLFHEYCAVCHGAAGKGDGPASAALKTPPPDLTQISKRNGGKFPEIKVQHIINGDADQPVAHGSKDMPVWGHIFRHMGANSDVGNVRVYNLVKYIEEMQAK